MSSKTPTVRASKVKSEGRWFAAKMSSVGTPPGVTGTGIASGSVRPPP